MAAARNLGDAYLAMGRRGDATRAYEKALELLQTQLAVNPRDADAISTLSIVEAKLGRLAASRRHAAEALALLPAARDPDAPFLPPFLPRLTLHRPAVS